MTEGAHHGMMGVDAILSFACTEKSSFMSKRQSSGSIEAVFGRLHPAVDLPMSKADYTNAIRKIAIAMEEDETTAKDGPAAAGLAFLGQFIDHDLTLDVTTELGEVAGDVSKIRNFRTPRLDLDCVYGGGPEATPHLFDKKKNDGSLLFGREVGEGAVSENAQDLARNRQGTALIGDPRNDENLFVSQVQGRRFISRHNQYVSQGNDFKSAKQQLVKDYHEEIMQEFLPAIIDAAVLKPFVDWLHGSAAPATGNVNWSFIPDMPVEFSAAAYRFGHSMIRQTYDLNDQSLGIDIFNGAIEGFAPVEEAHNLDIDRFFGANAQKARAIDTKLPRALLHLPGSVVGAGEANLAFRNMERGHVTFQLPSGEQMASFLGFTPLASAAAVVDAGLSGNTPLWYYILFEAEQNGGKLGQVGGTIVAGVLTRLLIINSSTMSDHKARLA